MDEDLVYLRDPALSFSCSRFRRMRARITGPAPESQGHQEPGQMLVVPERVGPRLHPCRPVRKALGHCHTVCGTLCGERDRRHLPARRGVLVVHPL